AVHGLHGHDSARGGRAGTALDRARLRARQPEGLPDGGPRGDRRGGRRVDLHDGRPPGEQSTATLPSRQPTADAVPLILERLGASGYRFVTVSELFELSS